MRFWTHNIKETKGRRFFWHLYSKDEKQELFNGHIEVYWRKSKLSVKLHIGTRSSETPLDGHFCVPFFQVYWGMDFKGLGRICEVVGFGKKRDLSLSVFGGQLWWRLWYDDDMGYDNWHKHEKWKQPVLPPWRWGRKKYRSWMCLRDGSIELNPVSALWGSRLYRYTDIESFTDTVGVNAYPGDMQKVVFTLQSCVQERDAGPAWARKPKWVGYSVAWKCDEGIPTQNHDWKGDCVYASSVSAKDPIDMEYWHRDAVIELVKWVIKDRERNQYRPPVKE